MTQYIAKSTLITKGVRYQQGQKFDEVDLKELSTEQISAHFKEVVSVDKNVASETQAPAEINDESKNVVSTPAPAPSPVASPATAPAPKGKGGKWKAKGKGGK